MIVLAADEYTLTAIRAQGAGGQHVNKVSSAIHLRFDIAASSLHAAVKQRLLQRADQRISNEGVLVIKAQQYRTQEANKRDAVARLQALIADASQVAAPRTATRPTWAAQKRRVSSKLKRGAIKRARGKVSDSD